MCGDPARVVVKMLNTRRCDWPWPERIVTGEDVRGILRRLAMDEDEVGGRLRDCGQWLSILNALTDGGYVYLDSRSAQQPYGPLCRSCEREVSPADVAGAYMLLALCQQGVPVVRIKYVRDAVVNIDVGRVSMGVYAVCDRVVLSCEAPPGRNSIRFQDFKAELHPDDDGILHQEDIQTIIRGAREMRIFTGAPERS